MAGVGTGGTITGSGQYLKVMKPSIKVRRNCFFLYSVSDFIYISCLLCFLYRPGIISVGAAEMECRAVCKIVRGYHTEWDGTPHRVRTVPPGHEAFHQGACGGIIVLIAVSFFFSSYVRFFCSFLLLSPPPCGMAGAL